MIATEICIRIVPIGNFDEKFLLDFKNDFQKVLEDNFGVKASCFFNSNEPEKVTIYKIPRAVYNSLVGKYNTHTLFIFGKKIREESLDKFDENKVLLKILVLVDFDIFKSGFTGTLFGEAEVCGDIAIASISHLKDDSNELITKERAIKEALHVIGYTLGLKQCETPSCAMSPSKTLEDIDKRNTSYCSDCINKISSDKK